MNDKIKKSIYIFFYLTLGFMAIFLLDGILLKPILGFPIYYIIINVIGTIFTVFYVERSSFIEKNVVTNYFIKNYNISRRETDVIHLILKAYSNQEIGEELFISNKTVENHIYNIFKKTNVKSRFQLFSLIQTNNRELNGPGEGTDI